ncbi:putative dehydrogenase [Allocatelliglobosispora scoriae]|uniref:Putative dehydrogenase n=1 Tax=Allocatelliglobosispora scoriae TaxID=643052 RepID=A0A841BU80_9ACTN|nr:Gfo/Idh/MocA family oxidoreductase [Allocatelliglobosispora scoriae]MBB5870302.1 putative dehydrogenase [Allocatelliglobosispora scoriae]
MPLTPPARPVRVALIGANGHGMRHREQLAELTERGIAELVALADTAPVVDAPDGVPVFADLAALLSEIKPDVVIVCTPPHTHLALASAALRSGADVLLEKPPVLDLDEHHALVAVQEETGRVVQVGFQALASPALGRLREAVAAGAVGTPRGVSVLGAWQRDDDYWRRSSWSGRRSVAGRPSLDGALANPFAHALMQALAVLDQQPVEVEVAWCRVRDIEVEDTATLRVTLSGGALVLIAVTLVSESFVDGELVVHGSAGRAELAFREDLLRLPGEAELTTVEGRVTLLENLIDHRAGAAELLSPLARTAGFTDVIARLRQAPMPVEVEPNAYDVDGGTRTLRGVNDALRRCADEFALLTEIGTPWIATPGSGPAIPPP